MWNNSVNLSLITLCAVAMGRYYAAGETAVGLMNIMLVSVTRGQRKLVWSKLFSVVKKAIFRMQFLYESIMISLLGACFGSFLGILIGNVFSLVLNTGFVFPWIWLFLGMAICRPGGNTCPIYPSLKASRMNPIQALRYE